MTAPVVVRTEGLTKRFPEGLVAVDDLDLEVFEGDLYGFLGPNGAGKSTTIRMLLGLVFPTAGAVEVLGQAVPRHSSEALLDVGALIEGPGFYPHLSGRRNLRLFDAAGRNGSRGTRRPRIEEVMERVGLADVGRRPVKAYSMGMRQRLGLAAALLRQPRLLILDEPTNGLDPQGIHELRTLFVELVHEGTTVFLSSHLLAEVELICTRAAMMANGKLVAQDRVDAPAGADRTAAHRVARRLGGRGLPAHPAHDGRVARPAPPAGAPQRGAGRGGQQPARRPGPAHQRAGPGAADAGGRVPRAHGRHAVRAERGPVAVAAALRPLAIAERRGSPGPRGLGRGGRLVIGVELSKLLRRPRTWVTITLLAGLPVVVGIFLKATGIAPRPGSGPALLSEVLNNGVLFPAAALALILPVFLPVAVAVIAGDAIAGEASAGTLRYLLARPVSRSRLVTAKVVMALVFIVLAIAIVAIVGLIAGAALFGIKPLTSLSGTGLTTQQAIQRTVLAVLYIGWSMLGLAGIALFASTRTDSPLAAALSALAAFVTSQVLDLIDATRSIKPYLPTHYWLSFVDLFRDPILWRGIQRGVALQAVYLVVFLGAAWASFTTKDITS